MVDENSTYGPPSRDGGLRSEPDFSPFELPGSSNSHQATQDDMLTEEFMSPLDFLYSGNDLRALGRENTITTDSHNLLPEQFYKPEELQHGFHIPSDFNAVIPPNTLTSTLDFTDGGNNIPALGGQNSSSMDPHTFLPELFYSSDELQRGVHILPESSAVIQPNTLTSILDSTDGCNNLHVLGGENSISVDPHTFLPELVYNSEEPQRGAHISPESNTVIPANIFTSTLPSTDGGNDLPALGGESITSMAPPTLVPELEFLPGGFQCNGNVPLALSDGLLSEVFMPSLDSPAISNDLQISQAGSSTSMARPTVFPDWCLPPEGISSCGNIPTAFDHVLPPEAFDSGSDILQSDIGFRGLENEDFASIVVPHDQILPYGATASPLDLPYSGNNLQTMDEESHSHRSFQQDQTLPLQAITFTPDSLQGGNELEATGNMNFSYTPAVLGHMLGPETGAPALKVLYSGNDIQSLVRVVQNWPSASILDIRLKSVDSTNSKATPAVGYAVVIPSPWDFSHTIKSGPASGTPFTPIIAGICRVTCKCTTKYRINSDFADSWCPLIVHEGTDILPEKMVFGSSSGVSLALEGSLRAGVFRHMGPHSWEGEYQESFLVAVVYVHGVEP